MLDVIAPYITSQEFQPHFFQKVAPVIWGAISHVHTVIRIEFPSTSRFKVLLLFQMIPPLLLFSCQFLGSVTPCGLFHYSRQSSMSDGVKWHSIAFTAHCICSKNCGYFVLYFIILFVSKTSPLSAIVTSSKKILYRNWRNQLPGFYVFVLHEIK